MSNFTKHFYDVIKKINSPKTGLSETVVKSKISFRKAKELVSELLRPIKNDPNLTYEIRPSDPGNNFSERINKCFSLNENED